MYKLTWVEGETRAWVTVMNRDKALGTMAELMADKDVVKATLEEDGNTLMTFRREAEFTCEVDASGMA